MPIPVDDEITLPDCNRNLGRHEYVVAGYGSLCMEPAAGQSRVLYRVPTLKSWSRNFWYVWLIVLLLIAFGVIGCAFQSLRWYRRLQHRYEREVRSKRVDGMVRLMRSIYSRRSTSASQQRTRASSLCPSNRRSESLDMRDVSDDDDC
ncbi:hypothetical protein CUR178_07834 [Leishmania enriettii]|uniref:Transmembrane protein n=1 Tax=Leishmania enriettii TaxID=5663 RepID=A0A836HLF1_LEIEN|nr:hypothetical protein CUR178_07834 [Leishmania enriettii]